MAKVNIDMATIIAQAGLIKDEVYGAISAPIYQSATFRHPSLGSSTGFDYTRTKNPTRSALEAVMAQLERGYAAFAFSSGMAAVSAVLMLFEPGDHIIFSDDLYGGTYRVVKQIFQGYGLQADFVDTSRIADIESHIKSNTKAIFFEEPSNPMMKVTDIKTVANLARPRGIYVIVDNTFLSPYFLRPIEHGADIVVHSGTKFLNGHNDVLAGLVIVASKELAERIGFIQNSVGAVLSPHDSWLLLRGIKTLAVRLDRQQHNALRLASWLLQHPRVCRVYYPGLPQHPGHEILKEQANGFGSMISFEVDKAALARHVLESINIISFAESLGGTETLITYPAVQTHADIPEKERQRLGITDRLLRLSVGIEGIDDLISDLDNALKG